MILEWLSPAALTAFFQVVFIDIVLAGDNAVVVGMAAAGLPREQRGKVILVGLAAATVLRILFAGVTAELLDIIGLLFAGGILLLWVAWKMWRELSAAREEEAAAADLADATDLTDDTAPPSPPVAPAPAPARKTFGQAALQIVLADVSMSLDNVLAVAGAAHKHPAVLAAGLVISIGLMGLAASLIAGVLAKFRWIAYGGLLMILYVALRMIWSGALEIRGAAMAAGLV